MEFGIGYCYLDVHETHTHEGGKVALDQLVKTEMSQGQVEEFVKDWSM